jgi:hypothetical protein
MGQKSAEAIVGKDVTTHGGVVAGNKPSKENREDLPCRRAELKERDVLPYVLCIALNPTGRAKTQARHRGSAPQDDHSYCRLSKNWDWK